jgi:2-methylcitrate dehydratase PrpD
MGATAAAAKLLKLNIEQTMMAFGIAASLASGLDANSLSMTKALHFGNAARNGIVAATLAGEGFTANPEILDDPLGFSHTFAGGGYHVEKLTKELGNPFKLISDGPLLKKYPGCGGSHRALDAVLQLAEEHNILYEQVDSVEVEESSFNSETLKYSQPDTGYQAECSMEYVVAAAILDKKIVLGTFSDETIRDPKMKKAMKKVKVVVHPEWPPGAKFDTPVTIKLRDGSVYTKQIDTLRVSSSELATKYRDCAQKVLSPAQIKRSMELVLNLEHLNNVKELMQILTFGADEWK